MNKLLLVPLLFLFSVSVASAQVPKEVTCDQAQDRQGNFINLNQPCGGSGHCKVSGADLKCQIDPPTEEEKKIIDDYKGQPEIPKAQPVPTNAPEPIDMSTYRSFELPQDPAPSVMKTFYPQSFETIRSMQDFPGQDFTKLPGGGPSIFDTPAHVPYSGNQDLARPAILQFDMQRLSVPGVEPDTAPFAPHGATGFHFDVSEDPIPAQTLFSATLSAFETGFQSLVDLGERFVDTLTLKVVESSNWFQLTSENSFPGPSGLGAGDLVDIPIEKPLSADLEKKIEDAYLALGDPEVPGTNKEKMESLRLLQEEYTRMMSGKMFSGDPNDPKVIEYLRGLSPVEGSLKEAAELREMAALEKDPEEKARLLKEAGDLEALAEEADQQNGLQPPSLGNTFTGRSNLGGEPPQTEGVDLSKYPKGTTLDEEGKVCVPSGGFFIANITLCYPPDSPSLLKYEQSQPTVESEPQCIDSGLRGTRCYVGSRSLTIGERVSNLFFDPYASLFGTNTQYLSGDPPSQPGQTVIAKNVLPEGGPAAEEPLNAGKFAQPALPTEVRSPAEVAAPPPPPAAPPAATPPTAAPTTVPPPAPTPPPPPAATPPAATPPAATPPAATPPPSAPPAPPPAAPPPAPAPSPSPSPSPSGSPSGGSPNMGSLLSMLPSLLQLLSLANQPDPSQSQTPASTASAPNPVTTTPAATTTPEIEVSAPVGYPNSAVVDPNFWKTSETESLIAKITPAAYMLDVVARPAPDLALVQSLMRQTLSILSSVISSLIR